MSVGIDRVLLREASEDLDDDIIFGDEINEIIDIAIALEEDRPNFMLTDEEIEASTTDPNAYNEDIEANEDILESCKTRELPDDIFDMEVSI